MDREQLNRTDAAAARALKVRGLGDRPAQRRWQRDAPAGAWTPAVRAAVKLERATSDGDENSSFEGFASVTGQPYEMYDFFGPYDEQVAVGAFEETLAQDDLDVPLVIDHVSSRRIARTANAVSPLELEEVTDGPTTGLRTLAPTLDLTDPDTAYIVPKLRSGLIDEMSFRFMITEGRWSEDFMTFVIRKVDIHRGDVSIVGYGANPHTQGAGVRSARRGVDERARALLELAELGRARAVR
jgi:HK97 family phage prohead protease